MYASEELRIAPTQAPNVRVPHLWDIELPVGELPAAGVVVGVLLAANGFRLNLNLGASFESQSVDRSVLKRIRCEYDPVVADYDDTVVAVERSDKVLADHVVVKHLALEEESRGVVVHT